ncbi:MAG TPA: hypothetical protein VEB63_00625 [Chitinophagaceae bacterium]|nr:hypothetical protein [Chitinophagaceae bacterium]
MSELAVILKMRLTLTLVILIFFSMDSSSQNKSDKLFVFVGTLVPSDTAIKNSEGYVKLKYKILEKIFGNYDNDTIEFFAYYDVDKLKFTRYKNCFLSVLQDGDTFYKMADPVYDVYRTLDGRWANGAKWWDYGPDIQTSIKPRRLQFKDSPNIDLTGLSQKEIDHWYPAKYYERKGSVAIPVYGSYTDELFEIQKSVWLSSYFPSEKKFLAKQQIEDAVSGWHRAGILNHLTKEQILVAKTKVFEENRENLNHVIINFPDVAYWFDTELENLNDPYADFIRKLSEISHGVFQPTNVSDNFNVASKSDVTVRFSLNNKDYSKILQKQNDWIDPTIIDFIKQVLVENNLNGQFYQLYEGGQGGIIIFLTSKQYQELKTNKLVIFAEDD